MSQDAAAGERSVQRTRRVSILAFDEVEVLDACGPFEVFSVANRVACRGDATAVPPFEVHLVAAGSEPLVRARGGLALIADVQAAQDPSADVVLVPGGVTDRIETATAVRDWLARQSRGAEVIASVCTGAFVLAEAGLLTGLSVTTHWEDVAELRARFPSLTVDESARYLDHGRIATSAGVSAGIDLALHLVGRFCGPGLASATARQMDYPWRGSTPVPVSAGHQVAGASGG